MDFTAIIRRLADEDLPRIGATIGVGEDPLHAFLDVETAGGGYDGKGRLKALYEPHRAWRNAGRISRMLQAQFAAAGLAYPRWGEKPYPADSYPRIAEACAMNEEVALLSTSWGIGQVLGENFVAAGYGSVREMVEAYRRLGEAEQLESAVRFIRARGLDRALRERDWVAFAEGYNGPAQARNGYAVKLEARYRFWAGKPDTPWSPQPPARSSPSPAPSPAPSRARPGLAAQPSHNWRSWMSPIMTGLLRHALTFAGGALVAKGLVPAGEVPGLVDQLMTGLGGMMALGSVGSFAAGRYRLWRTDGTGTP